MKALLMLTKEHLILFLNNIYKYINIYLCLPNGPLPDNNFFETETSLFIDEMNRGYSLLFGSFYFSGNN